MAKTLKQQIAGTTFTRHLVFVLKNDAEAKIVAKAILGPDPLRLG